MLDERTVTEFLKEDYPVHEFYNASVQKALALRVHAKGEYPDLLLDIVRPNEEQKFKDYRKAVFKSPTKKAFGKVITTLAKIKKAEDWGIKFSPSNNRRIAERETLQYYTEKAYPYFDSVESWFFGFAFKIICHDPNAVVAVFPEIFPDNDTEFLKPFTRIFSSDRVIDFRDNELAVLLDEEKSWIGSDKDKRKEGNIYHILDRESYAKATQVTDATNDADARYLIEIRPHAIGYLPAIKAGSVNIDKFEGKEKLFDSFLSPCIDDWDEAVRRYSDHQVNMVKHVHPKEWALVTETCSACEGRGYNNERNFRSQMERVTCTKCKGVGAFTHETPFGKMLIKPNKKISHSDSVSNPFPPMGYGPTPEVALEFIKREVEDKVREGYQALNLEFLAEKPAAESGISKQYDREEMDAFLHDVADHLIRQIIKPCYEFINGWRYGFLLSPNELEEQLPVINVPSKFDIVHTLVLAERAKNAKAAGMSASIITGLELRYAAKEFGEDSMEYKRARSVALLDPLAGMSVEEKTLTNNDGGCTKEAYILSSNIEHFINKAFADNQEFFDLDMNAQWQVLDKYVQEVIKKRDAAIIPLYDNTARENITGAGGENTAVA